jgi:phytol kinase
MAAGMLANHQFNFLNYRGKIGRATYGDILYALAIFLVTLITRDKVFFALAVIEVAVADGLAAVAGITYGKNWGYKVFGHKKTVIGSMVFWMATVCIFGAGILPAHDLIPLQNYFLILLLAPPVFTLVENIALFGLDNLAIALLTVLILQVLQY